MPADAGIDELFEIRNAFYLGNYQQCINESQKLKSLKPDVTLQRDVYMYRSYIAQRKFAVALDEISSASPEPLTAVRTYAEYMAKPEKRSKIVSDTDSKVAAGIDVENVTFIHMAALIYMHEQNFDAALRLLHQSDDIQSIALSIQCLLKIDRIDLALKEVKKMQEKDEDATVTQLAIAWTNMALGKEKLQDAFYIFQEMMDKYSSTAMLLNAQASCLIQQQKYDQAETLLQEAMEKDPNNADTLINMIAVTQYMGKPIEVCNRYISQLKDGHANHPWTKEYLAKEKEFERLCKQYEVGR